MSTALSQAMSDLFSVVSPPGHRSFRYLPSWRWQIGCCLIAHQATTAEVLNDLCQWIRQQYDRSHTIQLMEESVRLARIFPDEQDIYDALSWTHYQLLMRLKTTAERTFYLSACLTNAWTVRQLQRQLNTRYYQRQQKAGELGIKQHYVFDFADIPILNEAVLESQITIHLGALLLEMGADFSYVGRQRMLTLPSGQRFYSDLVFYHCSQSYYLLVELKVNPLSHRDVGQLDTYVRLFDAHYRRSDDQPSVGLLLCPSYNPALLPYTVLADKERLFVASWEAGGK